ncbi:TetR family transcriptional regulator [Bacteroides ndongoniae]|uniref:TetR family transcriptional regulator n=1 Tax=Bacteroides ndongoniae TaxID=1903262 RepID=UPI001F25E466|nr:TetR family transcriptional regulator [Bacteroides ndongoniae]
MFPTISDHMRLGIIAEGKADIAVIKAVLKAAKGIDGSDIVQLRPSEQFDETDLNELNFSNWNLVLKSCGDEHLLQPFFDGLMGDALLVVQIDTAERGEAGYDIAEPLRTKDTDWKAYSEQLYGNVKSKITEIIPEAYRDKIAYAIAIEETDAWLIPLFDTSCKETAQYANPKEHLHYLINRIDRKKRSKYIDTDKKNLDYSNIAKDMKKGLRLCRQKNKSLDLFCLDIENKITE